MTKHHLVHLEKLMSEILISNLYSQFVKQLQKDLNRAGFDYLLQNETPQVLYVEIVDLVARTIHHRFNDYLNLLYAVDVSEANMRAFKSTDSRVIAEYATYQIFKREWQKVCFKNTFKSQ